MTSESKSSGMSGLFDKFGKTTNEIIDKFTSLQLILIKKQGGLYPHETFEEEIWIKKLDVERRVTELLEAKRKEFEKRLIDKNFLQKRCKVYHKKNCYNCSIWKVFDEVFSQQTVRQGSETSSVSQEGKE